jgi:hypothetical protein
MNYDEIIKRLDDYAALPRGWNTYDAHPMSAEAIEEATRIVARFIGEGPLPTNVLPCPKRHVSLEWEDSDTGFFLSITCTGSGTGYYEAECMLDGLRRRFGERPTEDA